MVNLQPIRILSALLLVMASAASILYILLSSDQQPENEWFSRRARPTVLLAVCSVVANVAVHVIVADALPACWWLASASTTTTTTTTIKNLDDIYEHGTSTIAAIAAFLRGHGSRAGLAVLAAGLIAANGPLLQRASSVRTELHTTTTTLSLRIQPVPAPGFSGHTWVRAAPTLRDLTLDERFRTAAKAFNFREDIRFPDDTGCVGECDTQVEGMGFVPECTMGSQPYQAVYPITGAASTIFATQLEADQREPMLRWKAIFKDQDFSHEMTEGKERWFGDARKRECSLRLATVRYPIRITNATVTLLDSMFADQPVTLTTIPNYSMHRSIGGYLETLWGFPVALQERFTTNTTVIFTGTTGMQYTSSTGLKMLDEYFRFNCSNVIRGTHDMPCWNDPTDMALRDVRELMFRAAISYANASEPPQMVAAVNRQPRQIYVTNLLFTALGTGAVVLGLIGVLPLLWGVWRLHGHEASWNPLKVVDRVVSIRESATTGNGGNEGNEAVTMGGTKTHWTATTEIGGNGYGGGTEYISPSYRGGYVPTPTGEYGR